MKRLLLTMLCLTAAFGSFSQNVGIGTNTPAASAQLDVTATNKGLLPPRVALTSTTDISTISAPATGLLVYNTATAGSAPTNVTPGYYYFTGLAWLKISGAGNAPGDIQYWNGTQWGILPAGTTGQTLSICGGVPTWGPCPAITAPTVLTSTSSSVTGSSATCGGNVTADGGATVTARGVCYATTANPTTANSFVAASAGGTGSFSVSLTGLTISTVYHYRAYATNSVNTSYGPDSTFTTTSAILTVPTVVTRSITGIGGTYATGGGNVTADGGATVTARGVCINTSANPDLVSGVVINATAGGTGTYTNSLSPILPLTLYHVRAFATNSVGTAYGSDSSFTTTAVTVPSVSTISVFGVGSVAANCGGNVTSNGGTNILARGICYATTANPSLSNNVVTDGSTVTGTFTAAMSPLTSNTTYHVRAYATNSAGTTYGGDSSFTTLAPGAFAATYTFDSVKASSGTTDPTPVPTASGATFGSFNSVGASANPNTNFRFSYTNWTTGATTGSDVFTSVSDTTTKYYEVIITPAPGKLIDFSSLTFKFQRSSTGVRQCFVRSSVDGFTNNLTASVVPADANLSVVATNKFQITDISTGIGGCTLTLGGGSFTNVSAPITFRFYGINAESTGGTFSIDDVVFNGIIH